MAILTARVMKMQPETAMHIKRPIAATLVTLCAATLGALAIGALAIGAMAIGRLAIGFLTAKKVRLDEVEIGTLRVRRLALHEPERPQRLR